MPVTIQWDNEKKTAARIDYIGAWTWEELYNMVQESHQMLDTVNHKVDMIQMWNHSHIPARGLTHARNLIAKNHPNVGILVMVGVGPVFMSLWKVLEKLHERFTLDYKFYFVETLEEARHILHNRRNQLSA